MNITNDEIAEKKNLDTSNNIMQVDKDERACEDVIMYGQLSAMGLEVNSDEEKNICTRNILQENELQKILENNSESEEYESLIVDNNIDAFRVKRGIMPGKYIYIE